MFFDRSFRIVFIFTHLLKIGWNCSISNRFKQSVAVKGNVPRKKAGEHASVERLTEVAGHNVRVINENAKIR